MAKPKLAIVIGSVRPNRFADHPAQWFTDVARQHGDFGVELIDLKDYPMPFFAETASPLYAPSENEVAQRWQKKMAEFDAYVFITAEYNRGPPACSRTRSTTPTRNGTTSRCPSWATAAWAGRARSSSCG
jgi:NAD(P)H-dependent FMN reductase